MASFKNKPGCCCNPGIVVSQCADFLGTYPGEAYVDITVNNQTCLDCTTLTGEYILNLDEVGPFGADYLVPINSTCGHDVLLLRSLCSTDFFGVQTWSLGLYLGDDDVTKVRLMAYVLTLTGLTTQVPASGPFVGGPGVVSCWGTGTWELNLQA